MEISNVEAVIWSKYNCAHCEQAKFMLSQNGIKFEERKIGDGYTKEDLLEAVPEARSVPQIFLNNEHVGGVSELRRKLAA